ncbi:MAG: hypothetical protein ABI054_05790 [Planctomycetota bacterium]
MRNLLAIAALLFLSTGCFTLERVPGPENPSLIAQSEGTLVFAPLDSDFFPAFTLVDLPSLKRREVRSEKKPVVSSSVDDQGRIVYLVDGERDRLGHQLIEALTTVPYERLSDAERWTLRLLNCSNGHDTKLLALDSRFHSPFLAPRGGRVVLLRPPAGPGANRLRILDLEDLAMQEIDAGVGAIQEVHWLPDGESFALTGTEGGAIVAAASGSILARNSRGYGSIASDGRAFLASGDPDRSLIELESGRTLISPARIPWPLVRDEPAHEQGESSPIGMCGPRLVLYPALPTEGSKVARSYGRLGAFAWEHEVLKVCDIATGEFATVWRGDADRSVAYSPVRLQTTIR